MKKFVGEFKKFINRGNVIDLAVAFIIGAAFKDIVNSLVNDILTPLLSLVIGEQGFGNYKYVITEANEALGIAENAIYYGNFIQSVFDFFIIALVIFLVVRIVNKINDAVEKAKEETIEEVTDAVSGIKPKVEDILLDIKGLLTPENKNSN